MLGQEVIGRSSSGEDEKKGVRAEVSVNLKGFQPSTTAEFCCQIRVGFKTDF